MDYVVIKIELDKKTKMTLDSAGVNIDKEANKHLEKLLAYIKKMKKLNPEWCPPLDLPWHLLEL